MVAKLISLSGIHNCQKTTTFSELKELYKNRNDILFISEIPTMFNNLGLGINNDDNQLNLLPLRQGLSQFCSINIEKFLRFSDYKYIIMDRCSLDITLYTRYFSDIGDMVDEGQLDDLNIDLIKSYYLDFDFKLFYFGMNNWIENKRADSMSKESGYDLEEKYFNKFQSILINFDNINQIIAEINIDE